MIEYGRTLKVSKFKYKIRYTFMGRTLFFFQFLYINVLNCRYFYNNCVTLFKNKKRWKIKKTLKTRFFIEK